MPKLIVHTNVDWQSCKDWLSYLINKEMCYAQA
jgi:hypothetical protein